MIRAPRVTSGWRQGINSGINLSQRNRRKPGGRAVPSQSSGQDVPVGSLDPDLTVRLGSVTVSPLQRHFGKVAIWIQFHSAQSEQLL